MKYYEMHEAVYEKLKQEGHLSWDKAPTFEEVWGHSTNVSIEKFFLKLGKALHGLHVLDLGTGTGTSALFTAKCGAHAVGVEISSSAIDIAEQNAATLGLDAQFVLADVLDLDLRRTFDLVIDSTTLHCIVGTQDRAKFYNTAKRHMEVGSYLFVNTMIASGDMSSRFPKEYFLFQDDVLWSLGFSEIAERKTIKGKSYFPHRTLLSETEQLKEFANHGLDVVLMDKVFEKDESFDLVALLKIRE